MRGSIRPARRSAMPAASNVTLGSSGATAALRAASATPAPRPPCRRARTAPAPSTRRAARRRGSTWIRASERLERASRVAAQARSSPSRARAAVDLAGGTTAAHGASVSHRRPRSSARSSVAAAAGSRWTSQSRTPVPGCVRLAAARQLRPHRRPGSTACRAASAAGRASQRDAAVVRRVRLRQHDRLAERARAARAGAARSARRGSPCRRRSRSSSSRRRRRSGGPASSAAALRSHAALPARRGSR